MNFEEVYRHYFKDIYRYTLSLTRDANIAEEIAQETVKNFGELPYDTILQDNVIRYK